MGKTEDEQRAARVRERGKEERAEKEAEAERAALQEKARHDEAYERLAASCHPLYWLGDENFAITTGVLCVLTFGAGVMFLFQTDTTVPRTVALAMAGGAVVVAAVALGVRASVRARMKAAWDVEAAWLAKLPFEVTGIESGLASTSSGHRLNVKLYFRVHNEMPLAKARELIVHVDPGGTAERSGEQLRLVARVAGDPEAYVARVKGRRLLFHDLVDGVLLPLHAEAPITKVDLDD